MTSDTCDEIRLLIQADVDGELAPAEAARMAAHMAGCRACAAVQAELVALSGRLRREAPYHAAPAGLHDAVRARLGRGSAPEARRRWWPGTPRRLAVPFGAGFALAACLALALMPGRGDVEDAVLAGHVRALQPGHLMDMASGDQHTVKPWFDGRLDFAPPVKDLRAEGFGLAGGRLDYVAGRPVAVLIYYRRQHVIDLFVWPEGGRAGPVAGGQKGYNILRWTRDGMTFWAASDLNAQELADFVRLWQAG
ncbi:MAG: anti-sigma factor [Acetobacteraceae bacterium]